MIVHMRIQVDHARQLRFSDHHIIQCGIAADNFAIPDHLAIDHAPPADAVLAPQRALQLRI